MAQPQLILHQYDISPFSQKAQKMMGLKGVAWRSVEMPLIAPKPDVEALTGGYRGTPVLQIGADVFVDNWMIAQALDWHVHEGHALNRRGELGHAALYAWSERFFAPLLHSALATYQAQWDAAFLADRKQVFPEVNFDALSEDDPERRSQVRAFLGTLARHLARGSDFVGGEHPDSWDVHAWGMLWMIHSALPDLMPIVEQFASVVSWYQRMLDLGVGEREDVSIDVAWDALKTGNRMALPETPAAEPLAEWVGSSVSISTGSADRGVSSGVLLAIDDAQAVIAVQPQTDTLAHVWFPRLGYHLSRSN